MARTIRYTPRPALTGDKVRFVGDPLACVIAQTVARPRTRRGGGARHRAAAVVLTAGRSGQARRAAGVRRRCRTTSRSTSIYGDAEKVAAAFAKAKHVTRLETSNQRMVVNAMEPRAAIGEYDAAAGKWTLYSSSQGVHGMKTSLMDILKAPADKVARAHRPVGGLVRHEGVGLSRNISASAPAPARSAAR